MKSRWSGFESVVASDIEQFLAHKRALGMRFDTEEKALRILDRYLAEHGVLSLAAVTASLLDTFLRSRPRRRPRSFNHLLGVLRRLFDWMVRQGRLARSPLAATPRRAVSRRQPFLFDVSQARRLLGLAGALPDNNRALRRGPIYRAIFGLMYGLGLRVGETSRLQITDVDLDRNVLVIRYTKFGKSRLVPFGPKMADLLRKHLKQLQPLPTGSQPVPLFSFSPGRPIHAGTISQTFRALARQLDLEVPDGVISPCVHHLRHSFAVGTLLRWYRQGIQPTQRLLQLSTFMGHVSPSSTAVYITITDELLHEANDRFERFAAELVQDEP